MHHRSHHVEAFGIEILRRDAAFEQDGSLLPDPRAGLDAGPSVLAADTSSFDPEAG